MSSLSTNFQDCFQNVKQWVQSPFGIISISAATLLGIGLAQSSFHVKKDHAAIKVNILSSSGRGQKSQQQQQQQEPIYTEGTYYYNRIPLLETIVSFNVEQIHQFKYSCEDIMLLPNATATTTTTGSNSSNNNDNKIVSFDCVINYKLSANMLPQLYNTVRERVGCKQACSMTSPSFTPQLEKIIEEEILKNLVEKEIQKLITNQHEEQQQQQVQLAMTATELVYHKRNEFVQNLERNLVAATTTATNSLISIVNMENVDVNLSEEDLKQKVDLYTFLSE